ncbi:hypothetical protein EIN_134480 [Entamoeba invadens IP1]|uniref:Uncharacterized protein n=1 Tax=Entamoeba invadens IP1 TaxID=370355 RepID=A0A0A1U2X2_ENTIV|nr:hypothetical protein EIN_134480 [Entamoeba invadens IP1]ELP85904.1 hypothetical protein EIN_134480 [Entamoeba invadens IP1]|eukprot:XP_004185250.1 hypothetical protein EIN_134480 [Entamoeba invadens IP1]
MEDTIERLSDIFSKFDNDDLPSALTEEDINTIKKSISDVAKPVNYNEFFDSVLFDGISSSKAEYFKQKQSACNTALLDEYYICTCSPSITLYFCPACEKCLEKGTPSNSTPSAAPKTPRGENRQEDVPMKTHQLHTKPHQKGKTTLYALCNCGNCCQYANCPHTDKICCLTKNTCSLHSNTKTEEFKSISDKVLNNNLEQLALSFFNLMMENKEAELLRLVKYLIDVFKCSRLAYCFDYFLASKPFKDLTGEKGSEFLYSGEKLDSTLCDYTIQYCVTNPNIANYLFILLAQMKSSAHSTDIKAPRNYIGLFTKALHNKSLPVNQSNDLANKFAFCLFGNTVHYTTHELNSLCVMMVFSLLISRDAKLKQICKSESEGTQPNSDEIADLKKNYTPFFASVTATKAVFVNRFNADDYHEMFKCIVESEIIPDSIARNVSSFVRKLLISTKKTVDLYTSMQVKLFEVASIVLEAIFKNAPDASIKELVVLVSALLSRSDAEKSNLKLDDMYEDISKNIVGDFRYAPLVVRSLMFLCRVIWKKEYLESASKQSKKGVESDAFVFQCLSVNKNKLQSILTLAEKFFVIKRFVESNLVWELPDNKIFSDDKLKCVSDSFLLDSFDPGVGKKIDLFMREMVFKELSQKDIDKEKDDVAAFERTLEKKKPMEEIPLPEINAKHLFESSHSNLKDPVMGLSVTNSNASPKPMKKEKSKKAISDTKHKKPEIGRLEKLIDIAVSGNKPDDPFIMKLKKELKSDLKTLNEDKSAAAKDDELRKQPNVTQEVIKELNMRYYEREERKKAIGERAMILKKQIFTRYMQQKRIMMMWYLEPLFVLQDNNLDIVFVNPDEKYVTAYIILYIDIRYVKYIIKKVVDVNRLKLVGSLRNTTQLSESTKVSKDKYYVYTDSDGNVCFSENGPLIDPVRCLDVFSDAMFDAPFFNPMVPDFLGEQYRKIWLDWYVYYCGKLGSVPNDKIMFGGDIIKLEKMLNADVRVYGNIDFSKLLSHIQKARVQDSIEIDDDLTFNVFQDEFSLVIRYAWISANLGKLAKKLLTKDEAKNKVSTDIKLKEILDFVLMCLQHDAYLSATTKSDKIKTDISTQKSSTLSELNKAIKLIETHKNKIEEATLEQCIRLKNKLKALLFYESAFTVSLLYSSKSGFVKKDK